MINHFQYHHSDASEHIWPEGEKPCIWMEAGLVGYKLCDHNLECSDCPFDKLMNQNGSKGQTTDKSKRILKIPKKHSEPLSSRLQSASMWADYQQIYFDPKSYYGIGFWYVKPLNGKRATLGLSDLAVMFLPPIREVILPRRNTEILFEQKCFWLVSSEGTIGLKSPLKGRVTSVNNNLSKMLNSVSLENRGNIWILDFETDDLSYFLSCLVIHKQAADYLTKQRDTIIMRFDQELTAHYKELGQTIQDGGQKLDSIQQMLGPQRYFEIIAPLF